MNLQQIEKALELIREVDQQLNEMILELSQSFTKQQEMEKE